MDGQISPEVLHWGKVSRLSGLQGPISAGGEDLLITEVARIYEALGREPSLSEHFFCTGLAYRVIMEHGTAWVKEKYLSELTEGNLTATLCCNEEGAGSDLNSIETLAKYDPDTESYNLKVRSNYNDNALLFYVGNQNLGTSSGSLRSVPGAGQD